MLLGFRCLRESRYYGDDPLVLRVIGLKQLPAVSTISRQLSSLDESSVQNLEAFRHKLVLDRLAKLDSPRNTLDFDRPELRGTVMGTKRKAEGTAMGFNKSKNGQRSFYPLYCTAAQTGQVLGVLNRSGNVHDSNGAKEFVLECIAAARNRRELIEVRMDCAFFSDEILTALEQAHIGYTISVPFARFLSLKEIIERRIEWQPIDPLCNVLEKSWQPESWGENRGRRVLLASQFNAEQRKELLQLDLFETLSYCSDFKVVITNRRDALAEAVLMHEGRGAQEGILAKLKSEKTPLPMCRRNPGWVTGHLCVPC